MNRRNFLLTAIAIAPLAACASGSSGAVALDTAKTWVSTLTMALAAAAGAYTGPDKATVDAAIVQLQAASDAFSGLGDVSTAKVAAQSWLSLAQHLVPMLSQYLPPNAVAPAQMALAMIQAFVASLPAPSNVPAQPPAALVRAGMRH